MGFFLLAVLAGIIIMVLTFILLLVFGGHSKKSNITYIILQTFLGSKKAINIKGYVDRVNDGSYMAEHYILEKGKKQAIGTFHQKWLIPSTKDKYIMFLEEYDAGRYRPIEYNDKDKNFNPIPNEDIDWLISRKEKNRRMLEEKKKESHWKQYLASGILLFLVVVAIFIQGYFMVETSNNLKAGEQQLAKVIREQNPAEIQERTVKLIFSVLKNETIRNVVKPPTNNNKGVPK